jgi:hypothetical protein
VKNIFANIGEGQGVFWGIKKTINTIASNVGSIK